MSEVARTPSSNKSSLLSSKFLSDGSMVNNRNFQRQSVVTILNEKPHFVKLVNKKLFNKTALEDFLNFRSEDFRDQSNS